jgi:hypothetical protein
MRLRWVLVVAVVLVTGALPAVAAGKPYTVQRLQAISAPSPFAGGCSAAQLDETRIAGAEIEPAITVNPADPRNIVATWQQDVGRGAARSDLIGTSRDGGRTWERVTIPGLSRCTGGSFDSATDPFDIRTAPRPPATCGSASTRAGGPAHARLRGGLHPSGAAGEGRSHRHLLRADRTPSLQARARLLPLALA